MNHILYNKETGVIENIIVLDPNNTDYKIPEGLAVISQENIQVLGWVLNYDTAEFEYKTSDDIPLEIGFVYKEGKVIDTSQKPIPEIPSIVLMKKLRLILLQDGILDSVEKHVSSLSTKIQILWEYETHVQRDGELIAELQAVLQLDNTYVDKLFLRAYGL